MTGMTFPPPEILHKHNVGIFMIAKGPVHKVMADITQPRAEAVLGRPIQRLWPELIGCQDPWEAKLHLPAFARQSGFDHVLVIDTDIVLNSWDWEPFKPGHFNGVFTWQESWPETIGMRTLVPAPQPLFNTGMWLAPTTDYICEVMRYACDLFRNELKDFEFKFWEETPLNAALFRYQVPVNCLPAGFNTLHHDAKTLGPMPSKDLHAVHFVEGTHKLHRVNRYDVAYPLNRSHDKEYIMQFRDDTLYTHMRQLKKNSSNKKTWTWLDLGAGKGQVSQMLSKILRSNKYHCIDLEKYHKVVKPYDGRNIPFGPRTFDFVLANFVLHHTKGNLEHLLLEAKRVLKPDGFLVIQEDILDGKKTTHDLCMLHDPQGRFYNLRGWRRKLANAGFEIQSITDLPEVFNDYKGYDVPRALIVATLAPTLPTHEQNQSISTPPTETPSDLRTTSSGTAACAAAGDAS